MSDVEPEVTSGEEVPEEEETWQGPSQEEYEAMQQQLAALAPLAEYAQNLPAQGYQEQQQQAGFDPFADDAGDQIRQIIREELGPVSEYTQQAQLAETENQAHDMILAVAQQAEFNLPEGGAEWIRARSDDYVQDAVQRYGVGQAAAEAAVEAAFEEYRGHLDAYAKAYHDQQLNQLSTLSSAPREPAAAGNPAAQGLTPARNEQELLARWTGRTGGVG